MYFNFNYCEFGETELSIHGKTGMKWHHMDQKTAQKVHYIPLLCLLKIPQRVHKNTLEMF